MPCRPTSVANAVTLPTTSNPYSVPSVVRHRNVFRGWIKGPLQNIAVDEGGAAAEETFDGVRLQWSEQAKKALRRVPRGYMRRNVKARIEKSARSQKIGTITNAFATEIINDSMGEAAAVREDAPELRAVQAQTTDTQRPTEVGQGFDSQVQWTDEAIKRLNLVPAGFMRNITQTRIEQRAQETISLKLRSISPLASLRTAEASPMRCLDSTINSQIKSKRRTELVA